MLGDLLKNKQWRRYLVSAFLLDVGLMILIRRYFLGKQVQEGRQQKSLKDRSKRKGAAGMLKEEDGLDNINLKDNVENGPLVLAIDCDGTLFNNKGEISQRSVDALKRFSSRGGAVILATGNPPAVMKKVAQKLGCNSYVICSSGAIVMLSSSWEVKFQNSIQIEAAMRIAESIKNVDPKFHVSIEGVGKWYVQDDRFFDELDKCLPGAGSKLSKNSMIAGEAPLPEFFGDSGESFAIRVLAIHPDHSADACIDMLRDAVKAEDEMYGSSVEVVPAGAPRSIVVGKRNVNKAQALASVCHSLGVPSSRVVAFGDNENDLEMLSWAGKGIAVNNAVDRLKKLATETSKYTNDQDAVAIEVEEILAQSDEQLMVRENLKRLNDQVGRLETQLLYLEQENAALDTAVSTHERFVELLQTQSPAKFTSPVPSRKKLLPQSAGR